MGALWRRQKSSAFLTAMAASKSRKLAKLKFSGLNITSFILERRRGFLSFKSKKRPSCQKMTVRDNDKRNAPKSLARKSGPSWLVKKPKPKANKNSQDRTKNIILKGLACLKNGHLEKLMALKILDWAVFNSMIRILSLCLLRQPKQLRLAWSAKRQKQSFQS